MKRLLYLLIPVILVCCTKRIEPLPHLNYHWVQWLPSRLFVIDISLDQPKSVSYTATFKVVVYNSEYNNPDHKDTVEQIVNIPPGNIEWEFRDSTQYYGLIVQDVLLKEFRPS